MRKGPFARDILKSLKEKRLIIDFYEYAAENFHIILKDKLRSYNCRNVWITRKLLKGLIEDPSDMPLILLREDNDRDTYLQTELLKLFCKEYLENDFS